MIDHVFNDLINAMHQSLESAMLEQLPNQEHLLLDVLLGDIHYENSYALPGEVNPPNLRVDINLEWPVWSQSIYRSWLLGESDPESLEVDVELVIRAVNMTEPAPTADLLSSLDERTSPIFAFLLERSSVVSSQSNLGGGVENEFELEIGFDGSLILEENSITAKEELRNLLAPLGPWIASMLVRLSDQPIKYFPDDPD
ncbi:MAG: hypothetical protein M0Z96_05100 [Actinomycetota bacterium]|nr:hypothetical protein [Actinomycetota bacterium]